MGKTAKAVLSVILFIIDFAIAGFTTAYIWNNVICQLFNLRTFTFWQGCVFSFAIRYFVTNPQGKDKDKDWLNFILEDPIYTLLVWFLTFLAVKFIAFLKMGVS